MTGIKFNEFERGAILHTQHGTHAIGVLLALIWVHFLGIAPVAIFYGLNLVGHLVQHIWLSQQDVDGDGDAAVVSLYHGDDQDD
jgi:hypothetical protein